MVAAARRALLVLAFALAFVRPADALAVGGNYVFDGGTKHEQNVVRAALGASAFDWSLVRQRVVIQIRDCGCEGASPGEIVLDAGDLASGGKEIWGVIQHEYGHQVDFFLLRDRQRRRLERLFGTRAWCNEESELDHARYGCERFASTVAWAYWPSRANYYKPLSRADEAGSITPARFRTILGSMLRR